MKVSLSYQTVCSLTELLVSFCLYCPKLKLYGCIIMQPPKILVILSKLKMEQCQRNTQHK